MRRRQIAVTVAVIAALVGLVILGLYLSDPSRNLARVVRQAESVKHYRTPGDGVDPSAVWITRSEAEIRTLQRDNQDLQRQLAELEKAVSRLRDRPPAAPARSPARSVPMLPIPTPPSSDASEPATPASGPAIADADPPRLLPLPPPPSAPRAASRPGATGTPGAGILVIDLAAGDASDKRSGTAATPPRHVRHYLPAGSFARAVLLSGLDAPTGGVANSNPHPILLKLSDHGTLPNRFRSRVKECFVTAAGYGDIASERAYLRLERLSCVLDGGDVVEAKVKGYVSGEDGKTGLRGRLVSKQGQIIAKSLLVGLAGGIGTGLAQSVTSTSTSALGAVQTVDPQKLLQYGIAQGASSALDKVADWYLQRANETYPIIEVDAGRRVDVILTEGVDLGADIVPRDTKSDAT